MLEGFSKMRRFTGLLFVSLLFLVAFGRPLWAAEKPLVTAVRAAAHDGVTRFVIEVSEPLTFQVGQVAGQVAVDVPELDWRTSGKGLGKSVGVLRNWTYGPGAPGKGRLMLETDGPAGVQKAFIIPPSDGGNYRLVIDLSGSVPPPPPLMSQSSQVVAPPPPPAPPPPQVTQPAPTPIPTPAPKVMVMTSANPILSPAEASPTPAVQASEAEIKAVTTEGVLKHSQGAKVATGPMPAPLPPSPVAPAPIFQPVVLSPPPSAPSSPSKAQPSNGKPVVVVDPGHGGIDPGAISLTGVYEKTIVLALAHDVQDILTKDGKVRCILTRDGDTFIPLRERVAIARAQHADLFMSLHADTVADPTIRGLSVYTLSQNSSDAEAQALADKENKSDIVAGIDLSNESAEVTNILIDLVQRESMNKSAVFASHVIRSVQHETHNVLEANTHRFAGFAVLKAPDVPSVLVENGYLSNVTDEQMLRKSEYRAKLATALAKAIENYFAETRRSSKKS